MSMRIKELRSLSDSELEKKYDEQASKTQVGLDYFTEEMIRRDNEKTNRIMIRATRIILAMTAVMLLTTIVNVIIAVME